jgi:hypothetical protein
MFKNKFLVLALLICFVSIVDSHSEERDLLNPAPERGSKCGGPGQILCEKGSFCQYDSGSCGENEDAGKCRQVPEVCAKIFMPVCGCDAKTYPNACVAAAEGQSVRTSGECVAGSETAARSAEADRKK